MLGPSCQESEPGIAWSMNEFRRGGTSSGLIAAVTVSVPGMFAVHCFCVGDTILGGVFTVAVVMQTIVLALFARRRYVLDPDGVTLTDLGGPRSHRWSEFSGYFRREDNLLLFFTDEERRWFNLLAPPSPEAVEDYVSAHLPKLPAIPAHYWRQ